MKICFLSGEKGREKNLAQAFCAGVEAHGDQAIILRTIDHPIIPRVDAVCVVGVKSSGDFNNIRAAGLNAIFLDKGYTRHRIAGERIWEYWRVAVNSQHPTAYLAEAKHDAARWRGLSKSLGLEVKPWRELGDHIVYAGSSAKYHKFAGLPDPTAYAIKVVNRIARLTRRPIIYRPKPSWHEAVAICGARYSVYPESIDMVLRNAWCLVTNGSNACFEAVTRGIPAVVLGDAVAKPISSQELQDVTEPYCATDEERGQWLANLAWCQFTEKEMESGLAWPVIRSQISVLNTR